MFPFSAGRVGERASEGRRWDRQLVHLKRLLKRLRGKQVSVHGRRFATEASKSSNDARVWDHELGPISFFMREACSQFEGTKIKRCDRYTIVVYARTKPVVLWMQSIGDLKAKTLKTAGSLPPAGCVLAIIAPLPDPLRTRTARIQL